MTDRVVVEIYAQGDDFFEISDAVDVYYDHITMQTLSEIDSVSADPAPENAVKVEWNESEIGIIVTRN